MSKITILKGKVLKGDRVEVVLQKVTGAKNKPASCSEEHFEPPHPDLTNAIKKLTVHAILLGEFLPVSKIKSLEDIEEDTLNGFHVSGFTINKDDEGVTLSAQKQLKSGKMMGFNTPFVVFGDDSENAYKFTKELEIAVAECRDEFEAYLGGKFKDDSQGKLFDEKD
jgi:hypothetical protein